MAIFIECSWETKSRKVSGDHWRVWARNSLYVLNAVSAFLLSAFLLACVADDDAVSLAERGSQLEVTEEEIAEFKSRYDIPEGLSADQIKGLMIAERELRGGRASVAESIKESSYEDLVTFSEFTPIPPPAGESWLLRWSFLEDTAIIYETEQRTRLVGVQNERRVSGQLMLTATDAGVAELVFRGSKSAQRSARPLVGSLGRGDFFLEGIREDSTIDGNPEQTAYVQVVFPLPEGPLAVGGTGARKLKMPFDIQGRRVWVSGSIETELSGFVKVRGVECALLESRFRFLTESDAMAAEGEDAMSYHGIGIHCFEVETGFFVAGKVASLMSVSGSIDLQIDNFNRFAIVEDERY